MELEARLRCHRGFHDLVAKRERFVAGWGCHFMTLKLKIVEEEEESKILQEWGPCKVLQK